MDQADDHGSGGLGPEHDSEYAPWAAFWVPLGVLGILAVIGAIAASDAEVPGDYGCGIILCVAAILLGFLRLKTGLDGGPLGWGNSLLVDEMWQLTIMIPIFAALGLAGLFTAASYDTGSLHAAGVALFLVSALIVFFNIKRVFDRIDRQH